MNVFWQKFLNVHLINSFYFKKAWNGIKKMNLNFRNIFLQTDPITSQ